MVAGREIRAISVMEAQVGQRVEMIVATGSDSDEYSVFGWLGYEFGGEGNRLR